MKKGVVSVFVICAFCVSTMMWTTGCTDKKPAADTLVVDSVPDTTAVDTMDQLISEQQMPKAPTNCLTTLFLTLRQTASCR